MSSDILDWVYAYLERDEDIVVPIKKLWNEWRAEHAEPSHAEFETLVLADDRFEEMGGVDHAEDMDRMEPDEFEEYERDMEAHGFFSGPRIKLESRELTLEHIVRMITKHNDRMEQALREAREVMPDEVSEEEEGRLIDITAMAEEFRRHLREAGLDASDENPDDPA